MNQRDIIRIAVDVAPWRVLLGSLLTLAVVYIGLPLAMIIGIGTPWWVPYAFMVSLWLVQRPLTWYVRAIVAESDRT